MVPAALNHGHDRLRSLLQNARRTAGLTQDDLAARLGVPQSFVSKYESGERRLSFVEVQAICHALGVSFVELAKDFEDSGHDS